MQCAENWPADSDYIPLSYNLKYPVVSIVQTIVHYLQTITGSDHARMNTSSTMDTGDFRKGGAKVNNRARKKFRWKPHPLIGPLIGLLSFALS